MTQNPRPWPMTVGPLLLRDPVPVDVDALLAFRNDPDVNRFMLRTHVDPETFRRELLAAPESDDDHLCVAELDGDVVALGYLEIVDGMGQPGMPLRTQGRIGYLVHPEHWGCGVGTGVAQGLLRAAFEVLGLRRVTAGCNADNTASVRILEGAGMRREQHGIADSWHSELGWVDGYEYGLLATEWQQQHAGDPH